MRRASFIGGCFCFVLLALGGKAQAQVRVDDKAQAQVRTGDNAPAQVRGHAELQILRTEGAEACPDTAAVRAAVVRRLGYDPFSTSNSAAEALRISVTIGKAADHGLEASVALARAGSSLGVRTLRSPRTDCQELAPTLELTVSLAIDPFLLDHPPSVAVPEPAAPSPLVVPAAPFVPVKMPPPYTLPLRPAPPRTHIFISAGTHLAISAAASTTVGFTAQFGVRQRSWSLAAEFRGDVPGSSGSPLESPGGLSSNEASAYLLMGSLIPCFHLNLIAGRSIELKGCAIIGAGAVRVSSNLLTPAQSQAPWVAAGARLAFEFAIKRYFAIAVRADLLGTVVRPVLEAQNVVVYQATAVSGAVGLDLIGYLR